MSASESKPRSSIHSFDIDKYLNPFIPRPRFYLLPKAISHFFGYRPPVKDASATKPAVPASNLLVWFFAFIGGFCGIAIIENVYLALPLLDGHKAPIVIASFGAAAILEYNAIESPLSQPRNLVFGHFLSATVGVSITKLFRLLPPQRFEELRWLAGAIAVGLSSTIMGITKTVHPPAGATALLAATSVEVTDIGWWLLPLVLLAASLMLASALILNNIYKRFPLFWWTPVDLSATRKKDSIMKVKDMEKAEKESNRTSSLDTDSFKNKVEHISDCGLSQSQDTEGSSIPPKPASVPRQDQELQLRITGEEIIVPDWMNLSDWDVEVLETFQSRIKEWAKGD